MKIQDYIKRRTKKCIICIMLIAALFLPAIRNNIVNVFADEIESQIEDEDFEASTEEGEGISAGSEATEQVVPTELNMLTAPLAEEPNFEYNGDYNSSETIEGKEESYTDGALLPEGGSTEGQELDYVEVEQTVTSITPHFYVTDENGNPVKDADGNDLNLEISKDAEAPIQVEEYDNIADENVVYGTIDEDGNFVEAELGEDGNHSEEAKAYTKTETADGEAIYEETLKKVTIGDENKEEVYVDQDVAEVIQDLIDLNKEGIEDEGENRKTLAQIQEDAAKKDLKVEAVYYLTKVDTDENGEEVQTIIEITPDVVATENPEDVYVAEDGTLTIKAEGNENDGFFIKIKVKGQDGMVTEEEIPVSEKDVVAKTVYTVKDKDGKVVVPEMDVATKVKIETGNFKKVNNKYQVKDINGNDVIFTADQWKVVTGQHVVYEETTKYYYTTENKYNVTKPDEITLQEGEKSGKLQVEFWQNDVIRRTGSVKTENLGDGRIKITIPYEYRGYDKDGKEIWIAGEYVETRSYDAWFNGNDEATLSIKYTPAITNTTTVEFSTVDEKITILPDGKVEVIENGGEPINPEAINNNSMNKMGIYKKNSNGNLVTDSSKSPQLGHVDVKTEGLLNEQIAGQNVSAFVSNVKVYIKVNDEEAQGATMYSAIVKDANRGDREYITS